MILKFTLSVILVIIWAPFGMLGLLLIWISKIISSIGYVLNLNSDKAMDVLTWDVEISGPDTIDKFKFWRK